MHQASSLSTTYSYYTPRRSRRGKCRTPAEAKKREVWAIIFSRRGEGAERGEGREGGGNEAVIRKVSTAPPLPSV